MIQLLHKDVELVFQALTPTPCHWSAWYKWCLNDLTWWFYVLIRRSPHDALEYLTRFDWNIHKAADTFVVERRPTPFSNEEPIDGSSSSSSMEFDPVFSIKEAAEALMVASQANLNQTETSV